MNIVAWIIRTGIGLLLIYSGLLKVTRPYEFLNSVLGYHLLEPKGATVFAAVLPFVELAIGIALVCGNLRARCGSDRGAAVRGVQRRAGVDSSARHLSRLRMLRDGRAGELGVTYPDFVPLHGYDVLFTVDRPRNRERPAECFTCIHPCRARQRLLRHPARSERQRCPHRRRSPRLIARLNRSTALDRHERGSSRSWG